MNSSSSENFLPKSYVGFGWKFVGIVAMLLSLFALLVPATVHAQQTPLEPLCYGVTDGLGNSTGADTLVTLNVENGDANVVGGTNTVNIEAIAFSPDGQTLYGADAGTLVTLDLASGAFTAIGDFGTGTGSDGDVAMTDVDGLTYDLDTNTLFGTHRRGGVATDLLFKIDPETGALIADGFGPGVDYLEVAITTAGDDDVDDIAADPFTGILYAAVNSGGAGGTLITIDKVTGAIDEVGPLGSDDIEGLGFLSNGTSATLYGSTGDNGPEPTANNKLFEMDTATGGSTLINPFPETATLRDYESLDCTIPAGLGDYVWEDTNQDGIQDAGEPAIPGVVVNLWTDDDGDGEPDTQIDSTATDADGFYEFIGLSPIVDYIVQFVAPTGREFTSQGAGANDGVDSNPDPSSGITGVITLAPGEFNPTIDAGILPILGSIGDTVSVAGTGEGIPNVTVILTDAAGNQTPTQTDANGNYLFADLPAGEYTITIDTSSLPADLSVLVTDPDGGDDSTSAVTLGAGENNLDQDFEYTNPPTPTPEPPTPTPEPPTPTPEPPTPTPMDPTPTPTLVVGEPLASLGDYVWEDTNENGIQDAGEPPVADVVVNLWTDDDGNGAPDTQVDTTTTDADGLYGFSDLDPAFDYVVQFVVPPGREITAQNAGDDAADSDADPATGITAAIPLVPGENNVTIDMGLLPTDEPTPTPSPTLMPSPTPSGEPTVSLGNLVWMDTNNNGVVDDGEAGIDGVTLVLWTDDDGDGLPDMNTGTTTTTAADGTYSFDNLAPGNYVIQIPLTNFGPGAPLEGMESSSGNDPVPDPDDDVDNDDNGLLVNGVGVINPSVTLEVGGEPTNDGDSDANSNLTVDFGFFDPATQPTPTPTPPVSELGSIGNVVFFDSNQDGVQDSEESGVPGVAVILEQINADGTSSELAQTITDENGEYSFADLEAGQYAVRFVFPVGYSSSPPNQGADDAVDSDGVPNDIETQATTGPIQLDPGEVNDTVDQGIYQASELGDRVFIDTNQDGIQDAGEQGLPSVTVNLLAVNADGSTTQVAQDTTDTNGTYLFGNLPPGEYQVLFQVPAGYIVSPVDAGDNDEADSDGVLNDDGTEAVTPPTTLDVNESDQTWDLGLYQSDPNLVDIGDFVFLDANANGIQDPDEAGIPNVTVILEQVTEDGSTTPISQATTGPSGEYLFTGLEPGEYQLIFITPDGHAPSPVDQGGDDATDSDGSPSTDGSQSTTGIVTLESGDMERTVDQGYYPLSTIGSRVWFDDNQDGIQNTNESGVPGVTVILERQDPTTGTANEVARVTTDGKGEYLFADQQPGVYTVKFIVPSGYSVSPLNSGADAAVDSDGILNGAEAVTVPIALEPGEVDLSYDLGLFLPSGTLPAMLGNRVWYDTDQDGIQDENEPGIQGFLVELFDANGVEIADTITDENGEYSFSNLVSGTYSVRFVSQPGYIPAPQDAGDDAVDSDADPATGLTAPIALVGGQTVTDIDAGFTAERQPPSAISNIVWYDENLNGVQDEIMGLAGIPGAMVKLFTADGILLQTRVTGADGVYEFINIPPGDYYLEFELPFGYSFSPQDADTNDAIDSDVDPTTGRTAITTLDPDESDTSWDAGAYLGAGGVGDPDTIPAGVGSRVWDDENKNGIQDAGEGGVPGVPVRLYTSDGTFIASTVTDPTGGYLFANLSPGDYYIEFGVPKSFTVTGQNEGGNEGTDSDPNPATGRTEIITLEPGQINIDLDAGIFQTPGGLLIPEEPLNRFMFLPVVSQ